MWKMKLMKVKLTKDKYIRWKRKVQLNMSCDWNSQVPLRIWCRSQLGHFPQNQGFWCIMENIRNLHTLARILLGLSVILWWEYFGRFHVLRASGVETDSSEEVQPVGCCSITVLLALCSTNTAQPCHPGPRLPGQGMRALVTAVSSTAHQWFCDLYWALGPEKTIWYTEIKPGSRFCAVYAYMYMLQMLRVVSAVKLLY